ncbi:MAG TPA: hypothetical protein VFF65_07585 [Phycisphaerales bacterium]|nr:hypothetical protein [Phycisphaerales bacterium]
MSAPSPFIPSDAHKRDPVTADLFNQIFNALRVIERRLARLEGLQGQGKRVERVAAYVVLVHTTAPSTVGNTTYTVRPVGQAEGGDLGPVAPRNRIIAEAACPINPRPQGWPCVIVRSFDTAGQPISWLELWEDHPGVPCGGEPPPPPPPPSPPPE